MSKCHHGIARVASVASNVAEKMSAEMPAMIANVRIKKLVSEAIKCFAIDAVKSSLK